MFNVDPLPRMKHELTPRWLVPPLIAFFLASPIAFAQSSREVLSREALNARSWALAPLETAVPQDIRNDLTLLREALLDEGKSAPKEGRESYKAGYDLCNLLISSLDEHDQAAVKAGYRAAQAEANTRVTNQSLDAHAPYRSSWPQYARIKDQRAEIQRQQNNNTALARERVKLDWSDRVKVLQRGLDEAYARYRQALREEPGPKMATTVPTTTQSAPPPTPQPRESSLPMATGESNEHFAWPTAETLAKGSPAGIQDLMTPEFAALPSETQFNSAVSKLRELNPEFKGDVTLKKKEIKISGGLLTNIWPLRSLQFEILRCADGGEVSDLSPLKGMPLGALFLPNCKHLSDLSALQGMPMRTLFLNGTQVRDLMPLRGTTLEHLVFFNTLVTDLSPLKALPNLRSLGCDFVPSRDSNILRSIKTLKDINHLPVEQFWKCVDAGESPPAQPGKGKRR